MHNRFAKTDEDLLWEQAEFLKNPRADHIVITVSTSSHSPRFSYNDQYSSFLGSPVSSQVVVSEHRFSPDNTVCASDELIHRGSGQPYVPLLGENITDTDLLRCAGRLDSKSSSGRPKTRSLFAKQLLAAKEGVAFKADAALKQPRKEVPKLSESLQKLADTGPTVIRHQQGFAANEIVRIHENNINLLSQLSEAEILREREAIIASADPKVISFLMHKKALRHGVPLEKGDDVHQSSGSTESSAQPDANSILASLGIEPNPLIPHMDVVEPEKLAWMQDLPHIEKAPTKEVKTASISLSKPCDARFDLEGRVVPPDADIPTYLGLHHHGDEPERGGYTVGELFHLASSSQPIQRRLAVSSLAAALAASRRGHHASLLQAPSLLPSLLTRPSGICFLLRWALDQCISEATRASAAVGGNSGGVSIALIGECFRALNNLLVDERGEMLLDEAFDWSSECRKSIINLSPSAMTRSPHKFRLKVATAATLNDGTDGKLDHAEAMAADPVGCLFAQTNLAARISWMLSPSPGLCLPPDTVAHALPALLIVAARHSAALALLIYKTPHLIASLTEHFLPLAWNDLDTPQCHNDQLSNAYGVPLPRVLKLMRVLAQHSTNLRLMLVTDWCLVERCLAYLLRLPTALPPKFGVLLQLESLRCLSVCLEEPKPPSKAVDLTGRALDGLVAAAQTVMEGEKKEDCLRIAWSSFFANVIVPRFSQYLSSGHFERIRAWAKGLSEEVALSEDEGEEGRKALPPALIAVTVHLLKALGMEELTTIRKCVFQGPSWNRILNHFIRHQSVLTGFPQKTSHADVLAPGVGSIYTNNDPSAFTTDVIFESGENEDLLFPITVSSAPPCLPDLGMSTCLFYRGPCTASSESSATLPAMWWPSSTHSLYPRDVVEPLDLAPPRPAIWPSFLPLVEAAVTLGDVDLTPWCSQLTRLRVPPVVEKACSTGTPLPHGMMAMETAMMQRYLLAQWSDSKEEGLWWATFHLLPYHFFGQEALLIELMQKVIFPVYDLTPIERGFSAEVMNALPPWPPVHESFSVGLAFHGHRVYVEYFIKLLEGSRPETQGTYEVLKTRPSCDFILPDDWFYMPLLEAYFWGCYQHTYENEVKISSIECSQSDSEAYLVKATACLGWIHRLVSQHSPPRCFPKSRELSAGGHLARLCCAILAYQGAGALCFNASGAIIAELISLLASKLDLGEMNRNPGAYLPLDLLSLYDLFIDLLEHYAAVSYSSSIFGNLLLLFLQPTVLPPSYRRALWGEHQSALRAFQLSPVEVVLPTAIYERLFEPLETDEGVLRAYASALCSGVVHPTRQPLAALIAMHHLNRNIYLVNAVAEHGAFVRQLAASLRFINSCGVHGHSKMEQLIDLLRRYKRPMVRKPLPASSISDLIRPTYVPLSATGGGVQITDLMELYGEKEMPPSRHLRIPLCQSRGLLITK
uniref:RNA polymerase II associated protein 1 n=1 Tax=Echinococcus granulosus TaxID=6210 RepID=A0A068WLC7_ECHGR|nr:RNA polymerase II associated protein 1 [Echinococcus granulosus]